MRSVTKLALTAKKYTGVLFFALLCLAAVFLFFKYLFPPLSPFLIALAVAFTVRPFKLWLMKRLKFPNGIAAGIAVVLILGGMLFFAFRLVSSLFSEISNMYGYLTERTDIANGLSEWFSEVSFRIKDFSEWLLPFLPFERMPDVSSGELLSGAAEAVIPSVTSALGSFLATAAAAVPYLFIYVTVTIVASFYFSSDIDRITGFFTSVLPESFLSPMRRIKSGTVSAVAKYFRAYSLIILITFTELFIGFSLLGFEYVFSLAVIVSIVDLLPILGTGTVLIPWSLISFLLGDGRTGAGLAVLYLTITVVRQVVEPRIVGGSIGLYPPLTLVGMYVGASLFGLPGLVLLPIGLSAVRSLKK